MLTTEQMVAFCGAHLIKELAYLRSFLPSCTEKDNNREGMALPCENPEGNNVKHIRMMTLYSHERYSHEEVIEEIKPSLFSADASSSQHNCSPNVRMIPKSVPLHPPKDKLRSAKCEVCKNQLPPGCGFASYFPLTNKQTVWNN